MGSLPRTVQELASKGEEIPEKFIHKDGDGGAPNAPIMDVPVVDIALLGSSTEELDKLRSALNTWGCFQAINHGMSPEFLNQVRGITKEFFHLPFEEKQMYLREENDIEGYGNDMVLSEQQKLDWTDRLYLAIYPEDQRKLRFWPEKPEAFRSTLHEYSLKLKSIGVVVLKAMARSLSLEENCFVDQYGERSKLHARFNFYPKCPRPDLVLGTKPHADGTGITLLLQDKSVEGLQFMKADKWYRAPNIPEALLINVGDQAEVLALAGRKGTFSINDRAYWHIWPRFYNHTQISSNGMFKSPVHRVVTNAERERISLAVFYVPDPENDIEPFEELINESRPRLYRKVKNYVDIYFQYYQKGRRPMEAAKIEV